MLFKFIMSKQKFFSVFFSPFTLTNTWASLLSPLYFCFVLSILSSNPLKQFLPHKANRKKPWPPLDFSVPLWRLLSLCWLTNTLKPSVVNQTESGRIHKGLSLKSAMVPPIPPCCSFHGPLSQSERFCLQPYLLKRWFPHRLCHTHTHTHTSRFTASTSLQVTVHMFFFLKSIYQSHQMGFPETASGDMSSHTPRPQTNRPDSPT